VSVRPEAYVQASATIAPGGRRAIDDLRRIAIWGHYHGHNLGDELVVSTIVSAVRRRRPEAEIVGIAMTTGDTEARHGIRAYPINPGTPVTRSRGRTASQPRQPSRRSRTAARIPGARALYKSLSLARAVAGEIPFAWQSYRFLRGIDLVVVAGSGVLLDEFRGPWRHPYTTFRWALLSRLARVPFVCPSVGAGPIDTRLGAFFIRWAIVWASFLSVRDRNSGAVLESVGLPGPFPYCPDMGYAYAGLLGKRREAGSAEGAGGGSVVGLNVMAHQDPRLWPRGEPGRYQAYLGKMVDFARWLLDQSCTVRVFSSQTGTDDLVAQEFLDALGEPGAAGRVELVTEIEHVDDLVRTIAGCDAVIAARFHSVLVPIALGIPVLGLAYNPKTSELLADVGLRERCLDIDGFAVEELERAFERLRAEGSPRSVRERVEAHRAAVEAQFDALLGPRG
jgi:polysaccharide pyruvyl transferase WcaK-like protein